MGIFSTAVPLLWMLGHKAGPDKTKKFNITTVILVVAALILSVLPFTVLVNKVYGLSGYYVREKEETHTVILGYANLKEEAIREAVGLLKDVWRE